MAKRKAGYNLPIEKARRLSACIEYELWHRGDISFKLKPVQLQMLDAILGSKRFKYVIKCSRRLGKSYLLCTIAIMTCLVKKGSVVRYAAPTGKALRSIVHPLMRKILKDCPAELRPKWDGQDTKYVFPNGPDASRPFEGGSEIYLAGVNKGHADDLRGPACDLFIVDEAGSVDDLHYLVHDVAMPQFLDPDGDVVADRRLIISGTPPRTPAHEFTTMAAEAELDGNYSHYDIFAAGYPREVLRMFLVEDGISEAEADRFLDGERVAVSTTIKREYLALDVVDTESALCPEWEPTMVIEPPKDEYFPFYFKYDSLDVGTRDKSVCVLGYYDFRRAKLCLLREVVMSGPQMNTKLLADAIKAAEREVFTMPGKDELYAIRKRVSDIDLLLIQDLRALHGLPFMATDKGSLEQMVNEVRIWAGAKRIEVSPDCPEVIGNLAFGVWNEQRTDFLRTKRFGHFDGFAAVMYLIRNIDQITNPIPPDYKKPEMDYWLPEKKKERGQKLKKMFNVR